MDNLQHIDDLLKRASQEPANAFVNDSDWKKIEKRLKQRKIRIYAIWIFLALVVTSTFTILLVNNNAADLNLPVAVDQTTEQKSPTPKTSLPEDVKAEKQHTEEYNQQKVAATDVKKRYDKLSASTSEQDYTIKHQSESKIQGANDSKPDTREFYDYDNTLTLKSSIPFLVHFGSAPLLTVDNETLIRTAKSFLDKSVGNKRNNYFEIGYSFTPSLSSKLLQENAALSGLINRDYYDKVANSESSAFATSNGINVQYHTASKFYISSGLFLTQRSEFVDYNYIIDASPTINGTTFKVIDGYDPIVPESVIHSGSNSYHFVEIPLNIGYKQPISRNFELRTELGVSYMSLLNVNGKKSDATFMKLRDVADLNLSTRNIAANLSSGVYYNTSKFTLGLEPVFSMNLNSFNSTEYSSQLEQNVSGNPIQVKPFNYGINISTNFKFNNR